MKTSLLSWTCSALDGGIQHLKVVGMAKLPKGWRIIDGGKANVRCTRCNDTGTVVFHDAAFTLSVECPVCDEPRVDEDPLLSYLAGLCSAHQN